MENDVPQKLPTDAHEDRWNRLAVSSKKDDLKTGMDVDERLDDYIGFSRHNISAGLSFQNQAYKDISKQDDKLKSFNQRILKEFEDLKRTKYFPNHNYRFPVSNEPLASSFLINPEQISPLIKASEERIKSLETEMDHRERDMLKMNGIVELLIEENKYLREHISSKNRDINKILETIGLNDGETTHDLRHRLSLLSEENNILLAHLEELKVVKDNFERFSRDKNGELVRAEENYEQCRQSLEDALKREELLTNYKQMIEPKFRQSQDKVAELEATVADLIDELSQVKNQNVLLSNSVASFKRGMEEIEGKNTLDLDRLVQEVNMLQNEKKELKKVIESKDKNFEDRQNELRKVRRDFEQTKLEFEEVVQVMNDLKNQLANERQTTESALKKERELKDRNNNLAGELEKLQSKLRKTEEDYTHAIESMKVDQHAKQTKLENKVQKLKTKLDFQEKKYKAEVGALKSQSEDVARILESVSAEREDYYKRWQELASEEQTFTAREKILRDLEDQIERLNKEIERYREELADTERRYRAQNDDLRNESDKLNEINKQLKEELSELRKDIDDQVRRSGLNGQGLSTNENTVETLRRRANDLAERNSNLRDRLDSVQKSTGSLSPPPRREQKDVTELEKENQYLQQMLKNMVQADDNQRSDYVNVSIERRISPNREQNLAASSLQGTTSNVRQSYLEGSKGGIATSTFSPNRSQEIRNYGATSGVYVQDEGLRPMTPGQQNISSYQMRSSLTGQQSGKMPRDSAKSEAKGRDSSNVEAVISGILKKYNMETIPDYVGKSKTVGGNYESTKDAINTSAVINRGDLHGSIRSPQMQFLSPLLSTPKYESKTESLSNSIARRDVLGVSPEADILRRKDA